MQIKVDDTVMCIECDHFRLKDAGEGFMIAENRNSGYTETALEKDSAGRRSLILIRKSWSATKPSLRYSPSVSPLGSVSTPSLSSHLAQTPFQRLSASFDYGNRNSTNTDRHSSIISAVQPTCGRWRLGNAGERFGVRYTISLLRQLIGKAHDLNSYGATSGLKNWKIFTVANSDFGSSSNQQKDVKNRKNYAKHDGLKTCTQKDSPTKILLLLSSMESAQKTSPKQETYLQKSISLDTTAQFNDLYSINLTKLARLAYSESLSIATAVKPPRQSAAFFMPACRAARRLYPSLVGVETGHKTPARGNPDAATVAPRVRPTARTKAASLTRLQEAIMAESTAVSIEMLRGTITTIDCFASESLSEIVSIAKLALAYMETPDAYRFPENIANALSAIKGRAEMLENDINCAAEDVGCNDKNDKLKRVFEAMHVAKA